MTDITQINNWFDAELVSVTDMQYTNALTLQMIYGSMRTGTVFGIVPEVTGGTFSVSAGFAFFGETTDPTYIANTGSTTLCATVEAQGGLTLVNPNCYIYVKPEITTLMTNRYTKVVGTAYSSVNPADIGIKICDVVAGVPKNFNKQTIADYLFVGSNVLNVINPDGSALSVNITAGLIVEGPAILNETLEIGGNLDVTGNTDLNGILEVAGNTIIVGEFLGRSQGIFLQDAAGPYVIINRSSSTLPNSYNFGFYSEVADSSIAGETHIAIIQANGGAHNPVLAAGYNTLRWNMLNCAPGDTSAVTFPNALAMLGDIALAIDALRTEILALL